jgi:hypothetical protein
LSDIVADEVLRITSFVGEQLADILFIETFRNTLYTSLKNGVANAINPDYTIIESLLTDRAGCLPGGLLRTITCRSAHDDNVVRTTTATEINYEDVWGQFRSGFHAQEEKDLYHRQFRPRHLQLRLDIDVPITVTLSGRWISASG